MSEPSKERPRIAVIGAGISGLAAAHRLFELSRDERRPLDVRILEASDRVGGVIRTEKRDGFVVDQGPDSFLSDKPAALGLCERLGITGRLVGTQEEFRRTYVAFGGALHPLPEGFLLMAPTRLAPLATSGLFSWAGKLRMALDLALPAKTTRGREPGVFRWTTPRASSARTSCATARRRHLHCRPRHPESCCDHAAISRHGAEPRQYYPCPPSPKPDFHQRPRRRAALAGASSSASGAAWRPSSTRCVSACREMPYGTAVASTASLDTTGGGRSTAATYSTA